MFTKLIPILSTVFITTSLLASGGSVMASSYAEISGDNVLYEFKNLSQQSWGVTTNKVAQELNTNAVNYVNSLPQGSSLSAEDWEGFNTITTNVFTENDFVMYAFNYETSLLTLGKYLTKKSDTSYYITESDGKYSCVSEITPDASFLIVNEFLDPLSENFFTISSSSCALSSSIAYTMAFEKSKSIASIIQSNAITNINSNSTSKETLSKLTSKAVTNAANAYARQFKKSSVTVNTVGENSYKVSVIIPVTNTQVFNCFFNLRGYSLTISKNNCENLSYTNYPNYISRAALNPGMDHFLAYTAPLIQDAWVDSTNEIASELNFEIASFDKAIDELRNEPIITDEDYEEFLDKASNARDLLERNFDIIFANKGLNRGSEIPILGETGLEESDSTMLNDLSSYCDYNVVIGLFIKGSTWIPCSTASSSSLIAPDKFLIFQVGENFSCFSEIAYPVPPVGPDGRPIVSEDHLLKTDTSFCQGNLQLFQLIADYLGLWLTSDLEEVPTTEGFKGPENTPEFLVNAVNRTMKELTENYVPAVPSKAFLNREGVFKNKFVTLAPYGKYSYYVSYKFKLSSDFSFDCSFKLKGKTLKSTPPTCQLVN